MLCHKCSSYGHYIFDFLQNQEKGIGKKSKEKAIVVDTTDLGEFSNSSPLIQGEEKENKEKDIQAISQEKMVIKDYPFSEELANLVSSLEKQCREEPWENLEEGETLKEGIQSEEGTP